MCEMWFPLVGRLVFLFLQLGQASGLAQSESALVTPPVAATPSLTPVFDSPSRPTFLGIPPPPPPVIVPVEVISPTPRTITLGFPPPPPPVVTPTPTTVIDPPPLSTALSLPPPPPPPVITLTAARPLPTDVFPFGPEVGHDNLSRTDDGCTERLDIGCNFVPALGQLITNFFVCANGIVTTNSFFHQYTPELFPGDGGVTGRFLLAPFWVDVDIRSDGYVWYGSHQRADDDDVVYKADELVHELSPRHSDFRSEIVYVATWDNVLNYPDGDFYTDNNDTSLLRNTFQAILITDYSNTFMIYNYIDIQFSGRDSGVVGYSAGDNRQFFNQPGSLTDAIRNVSQVITGNYTGLLFFHLTPAVTEQSAAESQCRRWNCDDKTYRFGDPPLWPSFLTPCPWTSSHAAQDGRYIRVHSSSGKGNCYIHTFPSLRTDSVSDMTITPETLCCYDNETGQIKLEPPNGGSSSPYHRFSPILHHQEYYLKETVEPYNWCCVQSSNCHLYFDRRPSVSTDFYNPLGLGWAYGDPHFRTMDGKSYTFNGRGEYIVMKTSDESFVLEGRAESIGEGVSTATVFTAFAMAQFRASNDFTANDPNSTVLHVQLTANNTMQVFARQTGTGYESFIDITRNLTELSDDSILVLNNVVILQPNNTTLEALFSSDISVRVEAKKELLTVVFAGPVKLMGETRGLLGVWDKDADNDFTTRNGTVLSPDASDRTIHFQFGQSWQLTSSESLFYYENGLQSSDFIFPLAIPLFIDEVNVSSMASSALTTACSGDLECLFDGIVTGDIEVAIQTLATKQTNEGNVLILANSPPVMNGSDTLYAYVNETTFYLFTVTDRNDIFDVILQGNLPPQEEYTLTSNGSVYNFTWTPRSRQNVSIQFLAMDSAGGTTLLHPLVRLCACHQEVNATCANGSEDLGENRFIVENCICGTGYGGTFCDEDIDGCDSASCFPGATCTDHPAPLTGATCGDCPNGFIAGNFSCVDVNECQDATLNNCSQRCVNVWGGFMCQCSSGFTMNGDGVSCDDVDECQFWFRNDCEQICVNTIGSFVCNCSGGYTLTEDGKSCDEQSSQSTGITPTAVITLTPMSTVIELVPPPPPPVIRPNTINAPSPTSSYITSSLSPSLGITDSNVIDILPSPTSTVLRLQPPALPPVVRSNTINAPSPTSSFMAISLSPSLGITDSTVTDILPTPTSTVLGLPSLSPSSVINKPNTISSIALSPILSPSTTRSSRIIPLSSTVSITTALGLPSPSASSAFRSSLAISPSATFNHSLITSASTFTSSSFSGFAETFTSSASIAFVSTPTSSSIAPVPVTTSSASIALESISTSVSAIASMTTPTSLISIASVSTPTSSSIAPVSSAAIALGSISTSSASIASVTTTSSASVASVITSSASIASVTTLTSSASIASVITSSASIASVITSSASIASVTTSTSSASIASMITSSASIASTTEFSSPVPSVAISTSSPVIAFVETLSSFETTAFATALLTSTASTGFLASAALTSTTMPVVPSAIFTSGVSAKLTDISTLFSTFPVVDSLPASNILISTPLMTAMFTAAAEVQATASSMISSTLLSTPTPTPLSSTQHYVFPFGHDAGDETLSRTDDGCTERLDIGCRRVPALGQLISSFFVCANGIVSAESSFHLYSPQLFPGAPRLSNRLLFAPFWVDVDIRREGNIWYGSHHKGDDNVTERADELIHELHPWHFAFKSKVVYVATWENVPNYPDGSFFFEGDEYSALRNTFQAALITDYLNTFLVYSYIDIQFAGRQNAVVGYTAGDGWQFVNQPKSQTDAINSIDHEVETGNYTGLLLFHLTPVTQSTAELQCREWYCDDRNRFGDTAAWPFIFSPCPWTLFHAARDRRYGQVASSIKGECYIQRFPSFFFIGNSIVLAETECCYHFGWLNLGFPFGGSASPYHRFSRFIDDQISYDRLTAEPYNWCCLNSRNCHLYYERRPSVPSWFYWPPGWGWFFGDPHIRTMDGTSYTFNGHGEYILMKTSDESFVLEGRAEPTGEGNSTATVFTAFAMAQFSPSNDFTANNPNSTVLHVQLTANNTMEVLARHIGEVSFEDITSNVTVLSNTSSLALDNVIISQPTNVTVEALFSSGISVRVEAKKGLLAVVFAGPINFMGQTRGLLGVWDQNATNDLTTRNGSVLSSDASDRAIHFQFGLSWEVNSNESLFYYDDSLGPSDYSFPEAIPLFFDEVNLTAIASPELVTACGGDPVCLFDGGVTGDIEVASQSVETEKTNKADVVTLDNTPPSMTGNETLFAFINDTTTYLFTVVDANDTFNVTLQGSSPPPLEEYTFTHVGGVYNFTWTPVSTKTVSIQFLTVDSAGAPTLLHPLVRLCACHQELNASCTDGSEDPGENKFLLQTCVCGPGYGGRFCDEDVDGCTDVDCFPGVECTDNPAPLTGATCGDCPNGTIARNDSCEDINECGSNATNDCDQKCSNNMGSYTCSCNTGYTLDENGRSCNDINECDDLSRCHQICHNTNGSFYCACHLGFELDNDAVTCRPTHVCEEPVFCEQLCAVGRGGNECSCNQGFEIDSNNRNCSDVDECAHENGNNCDHTCTNTVGSFVCSCRTGYNLNADGHSCDDVNECIALSTPCPAMTQICHNTDGGYSCLCPSGTFNFDGACRTLVAGETPPPTEPPTEPSTTSRLVTVTDHVSTTEAGRSPVTTAMPDTSLGEVHTTFSNITVAQFNETKFKNAVAEAVSSHCYGREDCVQAENKKHLGNINVTFGDVIILSTSQAGSDVITIFYIFSPDKASTISAMTVVQALQTASARSSFQAVGLSLAQVFVANPRTSAATTTASFATTAVTDLPTKLDTAPSADKASIIGGAISGVIVIILISAAIYFVMSSKKRAKVKPLDDSNPYELPLEPVQGPNGHSRNSRQETLE